MAGSSLFALIDDIASVLDDVSLLTKVAAKKTSGVLGDDLALNAEQVIGIQAHRELPVVWAVAKGSVLNKLVLVPLALIISSFVPQLITPLLMLGGFYLCYEGVEKVLHSFSSRKATEQSHHKEHLEHLNLSSEDLLKIEKNKIRGAIKTDFILSAEIITITLGTVSSANLSTQIMVLIGVSILMTVGVYGLVAGIVKIDDLGLYLLQHRLAVKPTSLFRKVGIFLIKITPYLMKTLSVVGTLAMFLVGGGILSHGLHPPTIAFLPAWTQDGLLGFCAGLIGVSLTLLIKKFRKYLQI